MPQAGFTDIHGEPWKFSEIDVLKDAARFNCSPATLAMLIDAATSRKGIDFSASQLSTTPRQHVLKALTDYYPTTGQSMAAHMGTFKHQTINVSRDGMIVEQRFTSKRIPNLSGQIDHASVVELTDDGTLVVDLYDLKTTKWYSVMLMVKDVWENHPDYAWQLNLCAAMMEEQEHVELIYDSCDSVAGRERHSPSWVTPQRIRVRNLYLECIPSDSSYKHEEEARKLGIPEYQKVIIPVSRKSADEIYAVYEKAMAIRDEAIAAGYAPICEERWSNKTVRDLRCKSYCDVAVQCKALSLARGEWHPLATDEELLAASIAMKETA